MNKPELFHKTISILVKAYQNDTLLHGDCHACAVGNLVAANTGRKVIVLERHEDDEECCETDESLPCLEAKWSDESLPWWSKVFMTEVFVGQYIREECYCGTAKIEIDSTGYSVLELALIEKSFESINDFEEENSDQHQFDGLMAVVDALMEIHEATKEEAEEAKLLFVK